MPKFSVIIPVYNAEKNLCQCVNSLLEQNYDDYEIILINDSSTDSSLSICKNIEANNDRVLVIDQKENQGVSAARNQGIEYASGEYILFVDSDDFVDKCYFETLDKLTKNSNCELFEFGNYNYLVSPDGQVNIKNSQMNINLSTEDGDQWCDLFLKSFFASPWNKIYRKSILVLHNIRFAPECVCYEDYIFNVEYCKYVNSFKVVDIPIYYYRQFTNVNLISKRKWKRIFEISDKVAKATEEIISLKSAEESLDALRRYVYKAYLVELEASKQKTSNYKKNVKILVNSDNFNTALKSIKPCGKKLQVYKLAKKLKLNKICEYILLSLVK